MIAVSALLICIGTALFAATTQATRLVWKTRNDPDMTKMDRVLDFVLPLVGYGLSIFATAYGLSLT